MASSKHIIMTLQKDFLYPRLDVRVYWEAKELLKRDYTVTVLCWTKRENGLPKFEEFEGIKIERVPHNIPPAKSSRMMKAPPYLKLVRDMAGVIKHRKPDLLHAHDCDTLLESSLAHVSLKIPFIYDSHEDYPAMVSQSYPMLSIGTKILENFFIGRVDHVIAATVGIKEKFERMGTESTVVYNSRPIEEFIKITAEERLDIRGSLGFGPDDFIVGFAGAIGAKHGTDMLIKVLPQVKQKKVKLLFIGGPEPEYKRVQKLIKDSDLERRIKVLPHMPHLEIMKYYQIMDAGTILYYPNPNYLFGAPIKIFEFMGYGIPMIASDFPEMHNILLGKVEASLLIDPLDGKAVVNAIETLASDPKLCKKYGKNLKMLKKTDYSWDLQRKRLYSVYDKLL